MQWSRWGIDRPGLPAGAKLLVQVKYLAMQSLAELLAIAGCRHGLTERDGCTDSLLGQQIENVGKQCHIAPPADFPLDGAIIQFVADGTGRYLHTCIDGGLQHGGVKAQDALSIGRGALGEKHDRNSDLQTLGDTGVGPRSIGLVVAPPEYAPRPAGIAANDGPLLDLRFGHEYARQH